MYDELDRVAEVWYTETGNITEIANASGVIQNKYWYDDLGQLRREDNRATGRTYLFNYDNAGNIQYRKTYAFTTAGTATSVSTTLYSPDNYTYGNANWGDLLTAYKGTAISYDTIGNPLNYYNGYTFTWQKGRQLATATNGTNTLSFTYNADGIRTSKTVNGVKHTYLLSGSTIMAEYWQQSGTQHVLIYLYDNIGSPVGMMYRTNAYAADTYDYFLFEKNLQGDIVAVYNASGTKLLSYTYDAWGNCTVTGSTTTGAQYNPFRYRGYYYDSELGLYYLNSRYYDSNTGRFINADGYVSTGTGLMGSNMYVYCNNNPVRYADPTGNLFVEIIILSSLLVAPIIILADSLAGDALADIDEISISNELYNSDRFSGSKEDPFVEKSFWYEVEGGNVENSNYGMISASAGLDKGTYSWKYLDLEVGVGKVSGSASTSLRNGTGLEAMAESIYGSACIKIPIGEHQLKIGGSINALSIGATAKIGAETEFGIAFGAGGSISIAWD